MAVGAPISRFELGRVVERTFSSLGRNFPVFLLLSALLAGVPAVLTGSIITLATSTSTSTSAPGTAGDDTSMAALGGSIIGLVYLVGAIASFVLQAAIIHGTVADLNGRRAAFGECISTGLRHSFWLFLLAIVVTVAEVFGYIFFIVPGLMMATAWIVAVPAQVVEKTGVFGSIGRSAELTRGHRWPIFGLLIIFLIGSGLIQVTISGVAAAIAASASPSMTAGFVQIVAQPLISIATSLVGAAGVASIYYELRSGREGIGPEALAAVFD